MLSKRERAAFDAVGNAMTHWATLLHQRLSQKHGFLFGGTIPAKEFSEETTSIDAAILTSLLSSTANAMHVYLERTTATDAKSKEGG